MLRRRPPALLSAVVALELASACARDNTETGFTGGGSQSATSPAGSTSTGDASTSTSSSGSTSGSSGSTSTGDDAASTAGASAGTWDVGTSPDFDPTPIGCQGKIDFLFVISSHYEMSLVQEQLQAAFPAFVGVLEQELAAFDYQIMVVSAGGNALLNGCGDCYMMCDGCDVPGCPEDFPCDGQFVDCDVTEGAGVTITGNFGASNKRCALATEHRYITTADAATLTESFTCIATLGEGPKTPVAMESMTSALEPDMLNGGCNDGFIRPDALLVVVVVQSNYDDLSPGTPEDWYDTLLTVKGGKEAAVVVLVISSDKDLPDPVCGETNSEPNELRILAQETAAHGRFLSVCEDDYGPFLKEGAALALEQCAVLVPQ
ncbi:MAG: hypothetical protein JNK56_13000 [Myxococcales bacterium]|nr:hypothetical protein [Myxococcales bacterium]